MLRINPHSPLLGLAGKKPHGTRTVTGQQTFSDLRFTIVEETGWSPPFQFTLFPKEKQVFDTF